MQWLEQNIDGILAAVGAVYVAARLIVVLTPTPKDDEALGKVSRIVRLIAVAVGLDKQQGLKQK